MVHTLLVFCCMLLYRSSSARIGRAASVVNASAEPISVIKCGAGASKAVTYSLSKTDQEDEVTTATRNGECLDWSMAFYQDGDLIQTVPVVLRHFIKAGRNLKMSANCYGFATNQVGSGKGNPGGNTGPVNMPYMVNEANLIAAMEIEGAIYLGRDPTEIQLPLPVEPERKYFLVAGFLKHEEFHFWGLMTTGWVAKPSKVGYLETYHKPHRLYGDCDPERSGSKSCCPSVGIFNKISKTGVGRPYRQDEGGFWLFPITEGNNECQ